MDPDIRSSSPPRPPEPAADRGDPAPWLGPDQFWDLHGSALFTMARTLVGDESEAVLAVTLGMTDVYKVPDPQPTLRSAAGSVYQRCAGPSRDVALPRHSDPRSAMDALNQVAWLQRSVLSLCVFGGHSYRDAATELGVPAEAVAWLLLSGLRELGGLGSPLAAHGTPPTVR